MVTINGSANDWLSDWRLDNALTGTPGYGIFGNWDQSNVYFAIASGSPLLSVGEASNTAIGTATTIWLDTDMDRSTGYQIWGFTGGAEYNIEVTSSGVVQLFSGGPGETLLATLTSAFSPDQTFLEFSLPWNLLAGDPRKMRIFADVNNAVFLPNDYSNVDLVVGPEQAPATVGAITLDGDLADWSPSSRLDTDTTGTAGYAIYGDIQDGNFVFAISADTAKIGANTTIWLDTDLDRATGYQIWGFTGGTEYNINIGADGVARLYTGGAGQTFVADLDHAISADGSGFEVSVSGALLSGDPQKVRVFADVNDAAFLPNDYANVDLIVAPETPAINVGQITLDGVLTDWAEGTRLDTAATGTAGYALRGDVQEESFVFAISAETSTVGANTTIWLDTDLDRGTGYQIWGFTGGAEYNINIGADGVARLYTGGAGQTFVAELDYAKSPNGSVFEVAVPRALLAGNPQQVRIFADVNDAAFLPNDYSNIDITVGSPPPVIDDPQLRIGIVFSQTTADNFYGETAYTQLFMAAQNQARMAGVPYDLLNESDLTNPANLAQYDSLIFPGFSHVQADQVDAIADALATASAQYGIGLIAAGNFMTNDQTGAALPGNAYARMQSLLGVTVNGFGQTQGLSLEAAGGGNPILDSYASGEIVGEYANISYLTFGDVTGTGEVLFNQLVSTTTGGLQSVSAVIATQTAGNNVHFATDAIIGNNNILSKAIDWVLSDGAPDVSLLMTRGSSLFYSRNDMDVSQQADEVAGDPVGVYDLMLPIVQDWYEDYGFVGSYYINVGANPPFLTTDWSVSGPYYQALLAMENEIGSHSYTHPEDTNLLNPDTQQILDLIALVSPTNPNAINPWDLSAADQEILEKSFRFQFETSREVIEQKLGIVLSGAAVPGAPEVIGTSREIIRFYDYMTGGYSSTGAGFPGAFGYLSADETDSVYLAPNISFDFNLIQYLGLTPEEATARWLAEYAEIISHAETPVLAFPWHDYGPTNLSEGYTYTREMFEALIAQAHADGTEFVTGQQLASRIDAFAQSTLVAERNGDVITATVTATDVGYFALSMGDEGSIVSVEGWYAWNDTDVLLPTNGGTFVVTTGAVNGPAADVTHVTALPGRANLLSVSGDGSNLAMALEGRGDILVSLRDQGSDIVRVTGVDGAAFAGVDQLTLTIDELATHNISIDYFAPGAPVTGDGGSDVLLGGNGDDRLAGAGGDDVLRGGAGADIFVFEALGGSDTVLDFTTGVDVLFLDGLGFTSAAEAYGAFTATAGGLALGLGAGNAVLLAGLDLAGLAQTDITLTDIFT